MDIAIPNALFANTASILLIRNQYVVRRSRGAKNQSAKNRYATPVAPVRACVPHAPAERDAYADRANANYCPGISVPLAPQVTAIGSPTPPVFGIIAGNKSHVILFDPLPS